MLIKKSDLKIGLVPASLKLRRDEEMYLHEKKRLLTPLIFLEESLRIWLLKKNWSSSTHYHTIKNILINSMLILSLKVSENNLQEMLQIGCSLTENKE